MPTLRESLSYQPVDLKFGTSGLRALITDMTDLECYINARGFIRFLKVTAPVHQVLFAGDLRESTPRIIQAVIQAIQDENAQPINCGFIPTPAIAHYGLQKQLACIMVTGSHIPDDRNGIKFYRPDGEVLKTDEGLIKHAVSEVRSEIYSQAAESSLFNPNGTCKSPATIPTIEPEAEQEYVKRYTDVFAADTLKGRKVVVYQHSAVGRDLLVDVLKKLGAEVIAEGRTGTFIPIDTENVTTEDQTYFNELIAKHHDAYAIVSTDGDSDRPFIIDEKGIFYRGDIVGAVVAHWLKADFAAYLVSSSDAVDLYLNDLGIKWEHTKIGSPYVIAAMNSAKDANHVVGWETNGGFLLGSPVQVGNGTLAPLPTRDALLPILAVLTMAAQSKKHISEIFNDLPARHTQMGLIDNFPTEVSSHVVTKVTDNPYAAPAFLAKYFSTDLGYGKITKLITLDGVRIFFDNGDIAHLRPSGNAPQLRIYSVANTQERADEIVRQAIDEDGVFRKLQRDLGA